MATGVPSSVWFSELVAPHRSPPLTMCDGVGPKRRSALASHAEDAGFEPAAGINLRPFSRRVPSATQPVLHCVAARRGWDSNPRADVSSTTALAGRRTRPLCDSSMRAGRTMPCRPAGSAYLGHAPGSALAEREGFEPSKDSRPHRLSKTAPSASRRPLQSARSSPSRCHASMGSPASPRWLAVQRWRAGVAKCWSRDLNPRHAVCRTAALPTELDQHARRLAQRP